MQSSGGRLNNKKENLNWAIENEPVTHADNYHEGEIGETNLYNYM